MALEDSLALFLAVDVDHNVLRAVRPGVGAASRLLAVLPSALEALAARVVESACTVALVVLEFALVDLTVLPVELSAAVFLAAPPIALKHGAVRPLEEACAVHLVIAELALVDLALARDGTTQPVDLALREEALKDGSICVDLDSFTLRLSCGLADLTPVSRPRPPLLKPIVHAPLFRCRIFALYFPVILEEVKWSELLVDLGDELILESLRDILIVLKSE